MPIASTTKEEKLDVLLQDMRDFCNRNKERYNRFFPEGADDLELHDLVRFFDIFMGSFPADKVVEHLHGGEAKVSELLAQAQTAVQAEALRARLFSAYEDWDDPTSPTKWGPDSLSSRHWER